MNGSGQLQKPRIERAETEGFILDRRFRLQQITSEVSNEFINLPVEKIDERITEGLGKVAGFLGFNGAAITKLAAHGPSVKVTHIWTASDVPPVLRTFTEKDFPWSAECHWRGLDVMLPTMDELPEAARVDRATFERYDARSSYSKVLRAGGMPVGVMALISVGQTHAFPADLQREIELFAQVLANALSRQRAAIALNEAFAFERTMAEISGRLLECNSSNTGVEVERGLQGLAHVFEVDRCTFWEVDTAQKRFTRAHSYHDPADLIPSTVESQSLPWFMAELSAGRPICLESSSDLPPDVLEERRYWTEHCLKSALLVPLMANGHLVGCFSMAAVKAERQWPADLVRRLQLAGELLANALLRKKAEEALRKSEERLSLAANSAGAGLWSLDLNSKQFWLTEKTREIFQLTSQESVTFETFLRLVHPDDQCVIEEGLRRILDSKEQTYLEYRVTQEPGVRWLATRGRVHCKPSGEPEYVTGVTIDVTAQKQAEASLREAKTTLNAIIDGTNDMIWCVDPENFGLITFNRGLREYFLQQRKIVLQAGMPPEQLFSNQEYVQQWRDFYVRALREGSFTTEYLVYAASNVLLLTFNRLERDGKVFAVSVFGKDITERKRSEQALLQSYTEIRKLKDRLQAETDYLKEEIKVTHSYADIIGSSPAIRNVLHEVEQVAHTDTSVLIRGETGTGKELVANAIHRGSLRNDRLMVMVNCAALPPGLVESELFGRERGAYTGALTRQAGRFELADNSTIFLDEIGELSLELQAKMLRVLEVGEFERLGSAKTLKVNVRLIAATNRDLGKAVNDGKFREDLYYRLNVFPIYVPPLRERPEDIPELVWAFVQEFSKRMGKHISKIPRKMMETLQHYYWPGNVRQLRNIIEHSVIISSRDTLKLAMTEDLQEGIDRIAPLAERERQHILQAMELTRWRIKGPKGAATKLGLKPSTLYSRMKKLEIPTRREKLAR